MTSICFQKYSFYWLKIHYCYLCIATMCFSMTIILSIFYWENMTLKLCSNVWLSIESNEQFKFPFNEKLGVPITIHCNYGRLGNQMCTLATLYGLAKLNRRNVAIQSCNYNALEPIFDFKVPLINVSSFIEETPWLIAPYLRSQDHFMNKNTNIIRGYYFPCSYTFFHHVKNDIRKIFHFRSDVNNYVMMTLNNVRTTTDVTLVGVHVRRSDYLGSGKNNWLTAFQGREVDLEYFQKATDFFKEKYDKVVFIAVSDDREWCRANLRQFGIQVLPDSPGPAYDMAFLASCDHVIMTYGTFGFWGGYLSGGTVVYFDKFLKPGTDFTTHEFLFNKMYLPEWIGIETNSSYKYD